MTAIIATPGTGPNGSVFTTLAPAMYGGSGKPGTLLACTSVVNADDAIALSNGIGRRAITGAIALNAGMAGSATSAAAGTSAAPKPACGARRRRRGQGDAPYARPCLPRPVLGGLRRPPRSPAHGAPPAA